MHAIWTRDYRNLVISSNTISGDVYKWAFENMPPHHQLDPLIGQVVIKGIQWGSSLKTVRQSQVRAGSQTIQDGVRFG